VEFKPFLAKERIQCCRGLFGYLHIPWLVGIFALKMEKLLYYLKKQKNVRDRVGVYVFIGYKKGSTVLKIEAPMFETSIILC